MPVTSYSSTESIDTTDNRIRSQLQLRFRVAVRMVEPDPVVHRDDLAGFVVDEVVLVAVDVSLVFGGVKDLRNEGDVNYNSLLKERDRDIRKRKTRRMEGNRRDHGTELHKTEYREKIKGQGPYAVDAPPVCLRTSWLRISRRRQKW